MSIGTQPISHREKIIKSCHNAYPLINDPGRTFNETQNGGVYYASENNSFIFRIDTESSASTNFFEKQIDFTPFSFTYNGTGGLQVPGYNVPQSNIVWDGIPPDTPTWSATTGEVTFNYDMTVSIMGFHGITTGGTSGEDVWTNFHIIDQGNSELYNSGRRRPNLLIGNSDNSNNINYVARVQAGDVFKFRVSSSPLSMTADANGYVFVTEV